MQRKLEYISMQETSLTSMNMEQIRDILSLNVVENLSPCIKHTECITKPRTHCILSNVMAG